MTTPIQQKFTNRSARFLLSCVILLSCAIAQEQKKSKYECDEPKPEDLCNSANNLWVRLVLLHD